MTTTPADPGAIDGLPCTCRFHSVESAIRQGSETGVRVDPDDPIRECDLHKAQREDVAKWKKETWKIQRKFSEAMDRTEAAEARVAALAGALEKATRALQETADWLADEPEPRMGTVQGIWNDAKAARTVLAATPADALGKEET